MAPTAKGNCYLCGVQLGKVAMKNHIQKEHMEKNRQECCLLKVEGAYDKDYWLYIDAPLTVPLSSVDEFLRKIWLECCGHMSGFFGLDRSEIAKSRKLGAFSTGDKLRHEYDFGTTTETILTIVGKTHRAKQKNSVRLLARNIPPVFECGACGKDAVALCVDCMYDTDNPFFCQACADNHEHEDLLPVTNSPRMGDCAYDGELDSFAFDPKNFIEKS